MKLTRHSAFLLTIITVSFGIRLIEIQTRPIWYDEAFSVLFAEKGPAEILKSTLIQDTDSSAAEEHPPLYYFGLWAWFQIFGESIPSARSFSILLSVISLYLIYCIARSLFSPNTALIAAGVAAILPAQVHFAQEIRMYSMLTLWLLLATFAFIQARTGQTKWWITFAAACALAQYTHNLAAIYLVPLAMIPLFQRDWKTLRGLTMAGLAALILYLPWMFQLPSQFSKVSSSFWVERPGIEKVFTLLLFYLPHLPLPGILLLIGLPLALFTVTLAGFQTYLAQRNKLPQTNDALWMAYLAFVPPLLLWLFSQVIPVYIERALLPSQAIFCIWLAWAFMQTKTPRLIQGLAALMVIASAGVGIHQHLTYKGFPYVSPGLTQNLKSRLEEGDIVIHSSKLSYLPSFLFDRDLPQGFILDPAGSSVDTLSPAVQQLLQLRPFKDIQNGTNGAGRVWFIIYQQSMDEYGQTGQPHPHLDYLNENFILDSAEEWEDIRLYLYTGKRP